MAITTMILGFSGEGLTYSLKNLDKSKYGVFTPTSKPFPFRESADIRRKVLDDISKLSEAMKRSKAEIIVIDDFDIFLSIKNLKMGKAGLRGEAVFTFLRNLAYDAWQVINTAINELDQNRRVYILSHADIENDRVKMRSLGRVFENMISPEGMCSIVLQTKVDDTGYSFTTQNNGHNPVKSPEGMFSSCEIPNCLAYVDKTVCEYYGIPKELNTQTENQKHLEPSF